jgi:prefoldin alpha subunit
MKQKKREIKEDPHMLAVRYSFYKARAEAAARGLGQIQMMLGELYSAKESLEGFNKQKSPVKILATTGGDVFFEATVEDSQHVLVNVGANIILKQDTKSAIKLIESKIKALISKQKELSANLRHAEEIIAETAPQLQSLSNQSSS